MTVRHPLAPYGIEDRQPLWNTQEPHGTCSCGEDAHPGIDCDDIPVPRGSRVCPCGEAAYVKGLCTQHYREQRRATMPPCSVDGCDKSSHILETQLCGTHYRRLRAWGKTGDLTAAERLWRRIKSYTDNGCWLLHADPNVYSSHLRDDGSTTSAHRVAYEVTYGPPADGLVIDHLCNTPACVNPAHLKATTQRMNLMRSETALASKNAAKTHCLRGHPLSGENLYLKNGRRHCMACRKAANARRYQEKVGR